MILEKSVGKYEPLEKNSYGGSKCDELTIEEIKSIPDFEIDESIKKQKRKTLYRSWMSGW